MLFRSSSTPISHSSSSSSSDSPTRDCATHHHHKPPYHLDNSTAKLSILPPPHTHYILPPLKSASPNSSPIPTNSSSGYPLLSPKPLQRAQSDSNLKGLSSISINLDQFLTPKTLTSKSLPKNKSNMLHTEPSFEIYRLNSDDDVVGIEKGGIGSGDFSFGNKSMGLIEEVDDEEEGNDESGIKNVDDIGGHGVGNGGRDDLRFTSFDESRDLEGYYKKMLAQDHSNALFLRNFAQFLQTRYRERIIKSMSCFLSSFLVLAKLVWELHHDKDRASSYFETAARLAPEDSHVLAAYASFLWEIDDDGDDGEDFADTDGVPNPAFDHEERSLSPLHIVSGIASEEGPSFGDTENYYKRKLKEDPSNPLFLRNYAHFLSRSKGDLQGAELYYSRAMLADPEDGEVISQYANLVWELHHDQHKASYYFERAVQAASGDCHVLAAHAKFLWEAEDDEEPGVPLHDYHLPLTSATA